MEANQDKVLNERSFPLDLPNADYQIGFPCRHAELWCFNDGEPRTEGLCKRIEHYARVEILGTRVPLLNIPVDTNYLDLGYAAEYSEFLRALSQLNLNVHELKVGLGQSVPSILEWIAADHSYVQWRDQTGTSILHVCGPPGSGTTTLASQIIRLLQRRRSRKKALLVSFSFSDMDIRRCSATSLFLSLSRQLLSINANLFRHTVRVCN